MARTGARALVGLGVSCLLLSGAACVAPPSVDTADNNGADDDTLYELSGGRYDQAYGDRIANKALRVNGRSPGNACLEQAQNSLEMAGVKKMPRLPGAADLDAWLAGQGSNLANWGFQKQVRSFGDIPRGSIVAWRRGQCGYSSQYGHIEIAVGGGRACSDFCGTIKTTCGAPNIYVPIGFGPEKCGTGTTIGAIDAKYQSIGGCRSVLGAPKTNEKTTPDTIGRFNEFDRGRIYWTPNTGAFEVHGLIVDKWGSLGWERGFLGYPITDEMGSPDKHGRFSVFQNGSIYWSEGTGAHEVHGPFRDKWKDMGWEVDTLGYPITDTLDNPDGIGKHQDFQWGVIYWSEKTGAHEIHGKILDKWKEVGIATLGYPTSDEYMSDGWPRNDFQNGSITWDGGSAVVKMTQKP